MAQQQPTRRGTSSSSVSASEIPDKLYFRIGEVARLCEVPPYVLRFWETEFPQLKPNKGGTGQRLFRRRDVETALRVKRLLYDEGYTIPGARQIIKSESRQKELLLPMDTSQEGVAGADSQIVRKLQRELRELHVILSKPVARAVPSVVQSIRGPRSAPRVRHAEELSPLFGPGTPLDPNAS